MSDITAIWNQTKYFDILPGDPYVSLRAPRSVYSLQGRNLLTHPILIRAFRDELLVVVGENHKFMGIIDNLSQVPYQGSQPAYLTSSVYRVVFTRRYVVRLKCSSTNGMGTRRAAPSVYCGWKSLTRTQPLRLHRFQSQISRYIRSYALLFHIFMHSTNTHVHHVATGLRCQPVCVPV